MTMTATTALWQPQEEGFKEIFGLVEQQISPTSDKSQILSQLQRYSQFPDFNNYLVFILARAEGKQMEVRQAAGLLLKNNLRSSFESLIPSYKEYIKSELLPCMGSADKHIRSTTGSIISVLVQIAGVNGWPELLNTLIKCMDSNDLNCMEGAMDALSKICEDIPQVLDSEMPGLTERPISVFLPRMLQQIRCSGMNMRVLCMLKVALIVGIGYKEGHEWFDKVLMGLLRRMLDDNKRVQEAACSAFATLEEEAADELAPWLETILQHLMCAFGKYQRRNLRIVYDAIGTLADAVGEELNQGEENLETIEQESKEAILYVNGVRRILPDGLAHMTLLEYLRGLTGTKLGCGACTVMVSQFDQNTKKCVHYAVNACLAPLYSVEGMHVITVEGVGNWFTPSSGLGEGYDGTLLLLVLSLETFGGGHNDPISAFGGPVMTKFTFALLEIGTYKEVLRSR